jgi:hypothetical protein
MSSHPKIRAVATAPTAAELEGPARDLVVAVLKMVPLEVVLELLTDQVRAANRAEPLVAALTLQGDLEKPTIQERSGPSLSTEEAGKLLGVSSETVRSRIAKKSLVGYGAPGDRTRVRVPRWQFDGNGAVHPWVPRLVEAFGGSGWGLLDLVTVPRSSLDGGNYLHLLLNGRADEVIAAALRSNPD